MIVCATTMQVPDCYDSAHKVTLSAHSLVLGQAFESSSSLRLVNNPRTQSRHEHDVSGEIQRMHGGS